MSNRCGTKDSYWETKLGMPGHAMVRVAARKPARPCRYVRPTCRAAPAVDSCKCVKPAEQVRTWHIELVALGAVGQGVSEALAAQDGGSNLQRGSRAMDARSMPGA